jgi:hypothetical protein
MMIGAQTASIKDFILLSLGRMRQAKRRAGFSPLLLGEDGERSDGCGPTLFLSLGDDGERHDAR